MRFRNAFLGLLLVCMYAPDVHAQIVIPHSFERLCGFWEYPRAEGITQELWVQVNEQLYLGQGVFINAAGDTTFQEQMRIFSENGTWYYAVIVPDQNNAEEIKFQLKPYENTTWYFENTQHDFPQKIAYTLLSEQEIFAWIEGKTEQGSRREYFHFMKRK